MDKYIYDESNSLWYELQGIIIFLALLYQLKKKTNLSVCGGSDINTTYRNINGRFIFRCLQAAN